MLKTTGRDFHIEQRFKSYAPIRMNTKCQWLVDGSDYMEAVAYAIKSATEEIYITDWFLSPEIYLKRPALSDEWRFDKMLEKKAVKINTLIKLINVLLTLERRCANICFII